MFRTIPGHVRPNLLDSYSFLYDDAKGATLVRGVGLEQILDA